MRRHDERAYTAAGASEVPRANEAFEDGTGSTAAPQVRITTWMTRIVDPSNSTSSALNYLLVDDFYLHLQDLRNPMHTHCSETVYYLFQAMRKCQHSLLPHILLYIAT